MRGFVFHNPVRVIFGCGELARVGAEVASLGRRACIVSYSRSQAIAEILAWTCDLVRKEGKLRRISLL